MTVTSSTNKVSFNGDSSTTVFAYSFKIFDEDDLTVILRSSTGTETTQTITTHYTVSGVGNAGGGNVTMVTAPATGETLTILREQPLTQGLDLVPNDPFPAESMEEALDKLTFMVQTHSEELDRALKASKTNTITSTEFTVSAADRANKVFAFDGSGDISVTQEIGTFRGNWATATAYQPRDLVKDTSTSNVFIVNTAHTSSGSEPLTTNANSAKYDLIVDAASVSTSASAAAASATAAASSATAAAASESNAATSESNAATSATTASTQATNAASSATAAAASEGNASTSETNAASSATAAAASETAAAASESAAATSETNAATSASSASTSATTASTAATTATTQASAAATSATNAATSETNASTSETNAATSATNAATSASAAAASQTAAAASAASAASAFDNFDDTYLGSKTSDPTTDNDGDPLNAGDLYFNSTANEMRVYDGANWIAATSAGNVSLLNYNYTATSGQTTFSGADDNAATLSYTQQNLIVTLNGITLEDGTDYTANNGTSIVLASGAATGDELNIVAFKSFTTADMVPASTGGTFSGSVTVTGDLTVDTNTLYVDSTNNRVGIGTSSPSSYNSNIDDLVVYNAASGGITIATGTTSQGAIAFADGTSAAEEVMGRIRYSHDVNEMDFRVNNAEAMRIDSSGNLRVGNTSGSWPSVDGCILQGLGILQASINNSASLYLNRGSSNGNVAQFARSSTTVGGISVTTSSTSFNTSSDYRLKEDVQPMTGSSERVLALNPVNFAWKVDGSRVDGFLAHEAQAVVPEAVTGTHNEVDDDGNAVMQGIDQSKLVPLLTAALKESIAKIEALEARVTALEGN